MPGSRLNHSEKKLSAKWDHPNSKNSHIKSISISTLAPSNGLRGIRNAHLDFDYPVTVIVGSNGSGKTTLLNLCAVANKPPSGDHQGYKFADFFSLAYKESPFTGICIRWTFLNPKIKDLEVNRKSSEKWMHYERRPTGATRFVGLSRISAPVESAAHKRTFRSSTAETSKLSASYVGFLSRILSASYNDAETQRSGRYKLPRFNKLGDYSGFNMGTGEGALITILQNLQDVPAGGIVLIEEVELGLHPEAIRKLAQVLVEISHKKDLQIICTSHSEWFIDNLPRRARILLNRQDDGTIQALAGITTRTAVSGISGSNLGELRLICEDEVGKLLIEMVLPSKIRSRITIIPLGSKEKLANSAKTLTLESPNIPILIAWDSDMSDAQVRSAHQKSMLDSNDWVEWYRLPGAVDENGKAELAHDGKEYPPEVGIKKTLLSNAPALNTAATGLNMPPDELAAILNSSIVGDENHHDLFWQVAQKAALNLEMVTNCLLRGYLEAVDLAPFEAQTSRMLEGVKCNFELPDANDVKR